MTDHSFPRRLRILDRESFERAYTAGTVVSDSTLVVHALRNDREYSRLGLSLSRKTGNAVVRNRWKRLIREGFRRSQSELPAGWDLIIRPRKDAVADLTQVQKSLMALARRLAHRQERRS